MSPSHTQLAMASDEEMPDLVTPKPLTSRWRGLGLAVMVVGLVCVVGANWPSTKKVPVHQRFGKMRDAIVQASEATVLDDNSAGCGESCTCPELGTDSFEMHLPVQGKTITVPSIPNDSAFYDYATRDAMIAVPKECADTYKVKLDAGVPLHDRQPGGAVGMSYVRVSDVEGGYSTLDEMLRTCACGLVVSMHGTGGPGWDTVSSAAMFAGFGLLVVMPDSQAMPDSPELKGRRPLKPVSNINMDNFCGAYTGYDGTCSGFNKPFCYSTKTANILANPDKYRRYAQRVGHIRKLEMDYFLENDGSLLLDSAKKVFLFGNSEGSMVARHYHHEALDSKLSGRIIMSGSCDFNYFAPCAEAALVCSGRCRKDVPQLNVIGDNDGYFGRQASSVSRTVADDATMGYGGPITGNCRAAYDEYGFARATVVEIAGAGHGPMYWDDIVMRGTFADFVQDPGSDPAEWGSLSAGTCKETSGVYTCEPNDVPPCVDWKVNPNATWEFNGAKPPDSCVA